MPRTVSPQQILGRENGLTYDSEARSLISGRRVLVTGAGGSIGSELSRQVARLHPAQLFVLDRDETLLQAVQFDIWGDGLLDSDALVLADIRDRPRLMRLFADLELDVVFHAAALKHLTLLENHPVEAVKTNILGTRNVVQAAHACGVDTFVNISTDKAADPTSMLGASKRAAEMVVSSHSDPMAVASVRFGNVLGSRGSFLTVLRRQLAEGRPVTVTHPDAERFFMTIPEAAALVIEAGAMAKGGESTFVLDMGDPVRITDVVTRFAEQAGYDDYCIRFTGLRPGEKLSEVVFSGHEDRQRTSHPRVYRTASAPMSLHDLIHLERLELAVETTSADTDRAVVDLLTSLVPEYRPVFAPTTPAPHLDCSAVVDAPWSDD